MPKPRRDSSEDHKEKVNEQRTGEQMQHVGLVLRARRRELNMSQAVLAKKMQTSQEVISNYENGVTPVRADDLPRFADILEVTPAYFFERDHQNKAAAPQSPAPDFPAFDFQTLDLENFDFQAPAAPWVVSRPGPQAAKPKQAEPNQAIPNQAIPNQAEHNKAAIGTLSEPELEEVLLAHYRTLGGRMRTLAVKLVRELAQDEQEPRSRVIVWKTDP